MPTENHPFRPLRPAVPADEDLLAHMARRHAGGLPASGDAFNAPGPARPPDEWQPDTGPAEEEHPSESSGAELEDCDPTDAQEALESDDWPDIDQDLPGGDLEDPHRPAAEEPEPRAEPDAAPAPATEGAPCQPATPAGEPRPPLDRADPVGEDPAASMTDRTRTLRPRTRPEADPLLRLAVQIATFTAVIAVIAALFMLTR